MPPEAASPEVAAGPDGIRVTTAAESPVRMRVEVEVGADRVKRAYAEAYRDLARRVHVPGFRPGKAPRSVLEKRFGASVAEQIEQTLVVQTLPDALERGSVEPVSEPAVTAERPVPGEPFHYTARVEIKPVIEVPDWKGLPAERPRVEVTDEEIASELESLRQRTAPVVEEAEGTPVAEGSVVSVDFVGRIGGKPFEGGTQRGLDVEIGAGGFLPGFDEQLVGAGAGDDLAVRVDFPDDYGRDELAGKQAEFAVHVAAVKRREVRALDDEFAKDLGEFATLDELRERIRTDLFAMRQREAEAAFHRTLLASLSERTPFEVPPGMVERELERQLQAAHERLHGRVPEEALHAQLDRWKEEWREAAEREVRERLLLEAVAAAAGVSIEDEEVEARIESLAEEQGVDAGALRRALGDDALRRATRARLADEKALALLAAEAKVAESSGP